MSIPQSIQGLQKENPRLYEAMVTLYNDVEKINKELFPIINQAINAALNLPVGAPSNFAYEILPRAVRFDWDDVENASGYEIREGTVWGTSSFVLRTISSEAVINPLLIGDHFYLIKTFNRAGNYSVDATALTVTINPLGLVTIVAQIIDNNVLLRWTNAVTQFQLDYYVITKNGDEIGRTSGTFSAIFEAAGGEYTYGVYAVDIAGNAADVSIIVVTVNQPPDFVLEATLTADLTNLSAEDNVALVMAGSINKIIACVNATQTWDEHFTDNSWGSIQDQINAGYPIYAEPAESSGYIEYIFDFTSIFSSVVIGTQWVEDVISGDINVTVEISYSDDNITYTSPVSGVSLFAISMRYAKVRLTFAPDDDKSLSYFYSWVCFINVKREMDGGTADVFAADVGGTTVNFNKAFKDVESITATSLNTVQETAVFDFVDISNPTDFSLFLFDAAGVRIDGVVAWKARGIF